MLHYLAFLLCWTFASAQSGACFSGEVHHVGACYPIPVIKPCYFAPEPTPGLVTCPLFKNMSCCPNLVDAAVAPQLQSRLERYGGVDSNCFRYYQPLPCLIPCDPDQTIYYNVSENSATRIRSFLVRLNATYAQQFYDACKPETTWWPWNSTLTVTQAFPTLDDFVLHLGTDWEAGFEPSTIIPNVNYVIGEPGFNPQPADRLVEQEANCSESPANIGGVGPTAQPLTYCSYYANSTCCFTSSESEAKANLEAKIGSLVGFGACYQYLKLLHCAWLCAPDQRDFITFDDKPGVKTLNMTVYVSEAFADATYEVCGNVCLGKAAGLYIGGGITVSEKYSRPIDWIKSFESSQDPRYESGPEKQNVFYSLAPAPTGGALQLPTWPWSPTLETVDTAGCFDEASSQAPQLPQPLAF